MAVCALSFITSPSEPVSSRLPRPRIRVASMNRTSPPNGVHASPVAMPYSVIFSAVSAMNGAWPKKSFKFSASSLTVAGLAVLGNDLARGFARQRGDFAFQLPHPGFAGVFPDEFAQRGVGKFSHPAA